MTPDFSTQIPESSVIVVLQLKDPPGARCSLIATSVSQPTAGDEHVPEGRKLPYNNPKTNADSPGCDNRVSLRGCLGWWSVAARTLRDAIEVWVGVIAPTSGNYRPFRPWPEEVGAHNIVISSDTKDFYASERGNLYARLCAWNYSILYICS